MTWHPGVTKVTLHHDMAKSSFVNRHMRGHTDDMTSYRASQDPSGPSARGNLTLLCFHKSDIRISAYTAFICGLLAKSKDAYIGSVPNTTIFAVFLTETINALATLSS